MVPQLRIADGSVFVKKGQQNNIEDNNNNNNNNNNLMFESFLHYF